MGCSCSCVIRELREEGSSGGRTVAVAVDGSVNVFVDEVVIDGDGGCGAFAGGGDDLGARVDCIPGGPEAGDRGLQVVRGRTVL